MKRVWIGALASAALLAAAACTSNATATRPAARLAVQPVAVTKDSALVAGCEQLQPVSAEAKSTDVQAYDELSRETLTQGGNYLLVADESARTGTAYRCTTPAQPPTAP